MACLRGDAAVADKTFSGESRGVTGFWFFDLVEHGEVFAIAGAATPPVSNFRSYGSLYYLAAPDDSHAQWERIAPAGSDLLQIAVITADTVLAVTSARNLNKVSRASGEWQSKPIASNVGYVAVGRSNVFALQGNEWGWNGSPIWCSRQEVEDADGPLGITWKQWSDEKVANLTVDRSGDGDDVLWGCAGHPSTTVWQVLRLPQGGRAIPDPDPSTSFSRVSVSAVDGTWFGCQWREGNASARMLKEQPGSKKYPAIPAGAWKAVSRPAGVKFTNAVVVDKAEFWAVDQFSGKIYRGCNWLDSANPK